ncbi:MAG: hypothetical protein AAGA56_31560 [Myxococcota bacterium]
MTAARLSERLFRDARQEVEVPEVIPGLPPWVAFLVVNAFVVAVLTWVFMPLLTRLFRGFLH